MRAQASNRTPIDASAGLMKHGPAANDRDALNAGGIPHSRESSDDLCDRFEIHSRMDVGEPRSLRPSVAPGATP
jgi:hypothetical protein